MAPRNGRALLPDPGLVPGRAPIGEIPLRDLVRKDVIRAAESLGAGEIRFLVDLYYQIQEFRKATGNQAISLEKREEPHLVVRWAHAKMEETEHDIKSVLDRWTMTEPSGIGAWAREIVGIGPVISAGLLAHIDISTKKTVGQIWRLAGLDPTVEWRGSSAARELVQMAYQAEKDPIDAVAWLAKATVRRTTDLMKVAAGVEPDLDRIVLVAKEYGAYLGGAENGGWSHEDVDSVFEHYRLHPDNAINRLCEVHQVSSFPIWHVVYDGATVDRDALSKLLSKRPWNAKLKVLCYKIGESFVKTKGHPNSYYGPLYDQRKRYEVERNESGQLADQAKDKLAKYKIGRDTEARKAYEQGILPDGHIDRRAKRWVAKLFLSHWFGEAYRRHNGAEPPLPYPIAYLGHQTLIAPPDVKVTVG